MILVTMGGSELGLIGVVSILGTYSPPPVEFKGIFGVGKFDMREYHGGEVGSHASLTRGWIRLYISCDWVNSTAIYCFVYSDWKAGVVASPIIHCLHLCCPSLSLS